MSKKAKSRPKGGKMSQLGGSYTNCKSAFSICARKKRKKEALIKKYKLNLALGNQEKQAKAVDPPFDECTSSENADSGKCKSGVYDDERECCMSTYPGACNSVAGGLNKVCDDACPSQFYMQNAHEIPSGGWKGKCENIAICGDFRGCPRRNDEAESLEDD